MNTFSRTSALSAVTLAIAAVALSACGSSDNGDTATAAATGGGETVSTTSVDGVGTVVVDSSGNALYSPSQEANGMIKCTGSCEQVWKPLTAAGTPTASAEVTGKLGTVKRPDGSEQVTYDGAPLYTFSEDGGPGKVTGDGLADSFDGKSFNWNVVSVSGGTNGGGAATQDTTSPSYGY